MLTSCAGKKSINIATEYVGEYYQNFSQKNSTQCYYQLNKNSSDILEQKYEIGVEDLLSARSSILGPVESYEIISREYFKEGDDKFANLEIMVKYKNAEVTEEQQIIIIKDGQTSINLLEFSEDYVILGFINSYKNALIMNDTDMVLDLISKQYFELW